MYVVYSDERAEILTDIAEVHSSFLTVVKADGQVFGINPGNVDSFWLADEDVFDAEVAAQKAQESE
jgi:hypothetical protein